ncbi:hypothetical protein V2G26_007252 [Clonostachys chloroleuca]
MPEYAAYSQAPSLGTSFSGVIPNGAPNAHCHHPRPRGTGIRSNGIGGANNVINASFNPGASTTTTTTNTNNTSSHANGTS